MTRCPTEKQYERLQVWAKVGSWIVVGRKAHEPLIRNGWVESDPDNKSDNPLAWLRITPDGLRAAADAIERHGRPTIESIKRMHTAPPEEK